MARIRKALEEKEEGFTLIELLVVIIIIGILAAIAIPIFLSQRQKAYDAAIKTDLNTVAIAEESYLTSNPTSYGTKAQLVSASLLSANGSPGDAIVVNYNAAIGYCLIGSNVNHPNVYYVYDSQGGGLLSATYTTSALATAACTSTDTGTSGGTWYGAGGS
jgi:type IV pilus assembly protein PilA